MKNPVLAIEKLQRKPAPTLIQNVIAGLDAIEAGSATVNCHDALNLSCLQWLGVPPMLLASFKTFRHASLKSASTGRAKSADRMESTVFAINNDQEFVADETTEPVLFACIFWPTDSAVLGTYSVEVPAEHGLLRPPRRTETLRASAWAARHGSVRSLPHLGDQAGVGQCAAGDNRSLEEHRTSLKSPSYVTVSHPHPKW